MDHRPLLGSTGEPTIGAVAAANISGPRRIMAGAARDSLIGVRFVNGRGEVDQERRAGDEERHRPRPREADGRLLGHARIPDRGHLQGAAACRSARDARVSPASTTAAPSRRCRRRSARPSRSTRRGASARRVDGGGARTLIRLEGFSASVDYRLGELKRLLKRFGAPEIVEGEAAEALWRVGARRDAASPSRATGRCGASRPRRPTGPALAAQSPRALDARWFYDWGGGLVWVATAATGDAGAAAIRAAVQAAWRPRHARARAGRGARRRRRVRAACQSR